MPALDVADRGWSTPPDRSSAAGVRRRSRRRAGRCASSTDVVGEESARVGEISCSRVSCVRIELRSARRSSMHSLHRRQDGARRFVGRRRGRVGPVLGSPRRTRAGQRGPRTSQQVGPDAAGCRGTGRRGRRRGDVVVVAGVVVVVGGAVVVVGGRRRRGGAVVVVVVVVVGGPGRGRRGDVDDDVVVSGTVSSSSSTAVDASDDVDVVDVDDDRRQRRRRVSSSSSLVHDERAMRPRTSAATPAISAASGPGWRYHGSGSWLERRLVAAATDRPDRPAAVGRPGLVRDRRSADGIAVGRDRRSRSAAGVGAGGITAGRVGVALAADRRQVRRRRRRRLVGGSGGKTSVGSGSCRTVRGRSSDHRRTHAASAPDRRRGVRSR